VLQVTAVESVLDQVRVMFPLPVRVRVTLTVPLFEVLVLLRLMVDLIVTTAEVPDTAQDFVIDDVSLSLSSLSSPDA
jgi:hypothetical protein